GARQRLPDGRGTTVVPTLNEEVPTRCDSSLEGGLHREVRSRGGLVLQRHPVERDRCVRRVVQLDELVGVRLVGAATTRVQLVDDDVRSVGRGNGGSDGQQRGEDQGGDSDRGHTPSPASGGPARGSAHYCSFSGEGRA